MWARSLSDRSLGFKGGVGGPFTLAEPLPEVVLEAVLSDHPAAQLFYENMRDERGDREAGS
jgi:hypothetical protein